MKKLKSSTDHFTGREREALTGIRKQLAREVQPLLVLYLGGLATTTLRRNFSAIGHNTTDFHLSCELLVVMPNEAPLLSDRNQIRTMERRLLHHAEVRLLVYSADKLAEMLSAGSHPWVNLHRQAIIMYEQDGMFGKIMRRIQSAGGDVEAVADVAAKSVPVSSVL